MKMKKEGYHKTCEVIIAENVPQMADKVVLFSEPSNASEYL